MARKRRLEPPHDWAWHEERLAEPHLSYHGVTPRQWRQWIEGKRQQMAIHDTQPPRTRALVAEHNNTKAREILQREAIENMQRCQHGRQADICAQCLWTKHQDEQRGRSGETLTRQSGAGRSARFRDV
jgi:hypothetical protein